MIKGDRGHSLNTASHYKVRLISKYHSNVILKFPQ